MSLGLHSSICKLPGESIPFDGYGKRGKEPYSTAREIYETLKESGLEVTSTSYRPPTQEKVAIIGLDNGEKIKLERGELKCRVTSERLREKLRVLLNQELFNSLVIKVL